MKILYGIQSTGNGHLSRSSKLIYKLTKSGCKVDVLLSGNNSQIDFTFPVKYNCKGFTFYYTPDGHINYFKTFWNLSFLSFLKDIKLDIDEYDLIISDFEPITAWASKLKEKECIGISNQCSFLSDKTPRPENKRWLGEFLLKNMAPVSKPIGLAFDKYDDFIYTPIIKENIIKINSYDNGHYTVYLPSYDLANVLNRLNYKKIKFEVFAKVKSVHRFKNCVIRPINKDLFENSIRNCHGLISSAGFQAPSEALFLGKKLMVIPIRGQYEQECNTEALKRLGVFTGDIYDIENFIESDNKVKVNWKDSTDEIVKIILSH
jgi:hypothetical protein